MDCTNLTPREIVARIAQLQAAAADLIAQQPDKMYWAQLLHVDGERMTIAVFDRTECCGGFEVMRSSTTMEPIEFAESLNRQGDGAYLKGLISGATKRVAMPDWMASSLLKAAPIMRRSH